MRLHLASVLLGATLLAGCGETSTPSEPSTPPANLSGRYRTQLILGYATLDPGSTSTSIGTSSVDLVQSDGHVSGKITDSSASIEGLVEGSTLHLTLESVVPGVPGCRFTGSGKAPLGTVMSFRLGEITSSPCAFPEAAVVFNLERL